VPIQKNKIRINKMNKIKMLLVAVFVLALTACGDFTNPLSSEDNSQNNNNDHTPLYSGTANNG